MGIFFLMRNVTKRSFLQHNLSSNSIRVWAQSPFSAQCRPNARCSPHHLCKIRVSKTSPSFYISPSLSYSSSSSSPYSKMGLFGWYLGKLESRPLLTKSVTASFIFAAADLTSQATICDSLGLLPVAGAVWLIFVYLTVDLKRSSSSFLPFSQINGTMTMPSFGSFDSLRTLRMAGYGMLISGPLQHMWYNFMGRVLPKRDVVTTLKKLIVGQVTYGPSINAIFFSFNSALQGESGSEIVARLKRDLLPTLVNGLFYWPVCDFLTFKVIPVHLQPLVNSLFSYLWTIYLTYMASLKKPGAD